MTASQEVYEPLWEDIEQESRHYGFRIRGIWMADISNQGESGVLNENCLGNDREWLLKKKLMED